MQRGVLVAAGARRRSNCARMPGGWSIASCSATARCSDRCRNGLTAPASGGQSRSRCRSASSSSAWYSGCSATMSTRCAPGRTAAAPARELRPGVDEEAARLVAGGREHQRGGRDGRRRARSCDRLHAARRSARAGVDALRAAAARCPCAPGRRRRAGAAPAAGRPCLVRAGTRTGRRIAHSAHLRRARDADVAAVQDQPVVRVAAGTRRGANFSSLRSTSRDVLAGREAGAVRRRGRCACRRRSSAAPNAMLSTTFAVLRPDAGQRLQRLAVARHLAAVLAHEALGERDDVLRLDAEEPDRR